MTLGGKAAIELGGMQALTGCKRVVEVETVIAAGDADLLVRRLFHGDAPVAAPCQRAEVNRASLFVEIILSIANQGLKLWLV